MLRITERQVRSHADEILINDLALAEQDIRLCSILERIYTDSFLRERLLLKGGTAINKLYLQVTPRLSIDLDFNHIGPKERVLPEREVVRERLQRILAEEDKSYQVSFSHRYEQTNLVAKYTPLFGAEQRIKLEISHIERFPILPSRQIGLEEPGSENIIQVNTLDLDELVSTKLRAFYERLSGRDLYDLYFVSKLNLLNPSNVRKMLIYYFYRSRKIFNPKLFLKRAEEAAKSDRIEDDVSGFVRSDIEFSTATVAPEILLRYSFLNQMDCQDIVFISLTRHLLGKGSVSKDHLAIAEGIEYPFRFLFNEHESRQRLSEDAWKIRTEKIKLYFRKRKH